MLASFPTRIQQLTGEPTLHGQVTILRYLIVCTQSQYTNYCVLKWLYLVVPSELWTRYRITAAYPIAQIYPGNVPAYLPNRSPAEKMAIRKSWQKRMKDWLEDAHMNKALIERFLSLLPHRSNVIFIKTQVLAIGTVGLAILSIICIVSTVFMTRWNLSKATNQ